MKRILKLNAPAKINLYLKIKGKRPDGFHQIETVFQKISLYDTLILSPLPQDKIELSCDNPQIPMDRRNLVWQATRAFQNYTRTRRGVHITLIKRIPPGAGLGGGSSDAATCLKGLQGLWGKYLTGKELVFLGASLGADVPFFLSPFSTARGQGTGNLIYPFSGLKAWFLLITQDFSVSTAEIYKRVRLTPDSNIDKMITPYDRFKTRMNVTSLKNWKTLLYNDLERVTFSLYPGLSRLKERLLSFLGHRVLMSGSGPTLFVLLKNREEGRSVVKKIQEKFSGEYHNLFLVKTE